MSKDEKLHPIAFYSHKFSAIEINYKIHNKKFLSIMDSFQEWRHFLKGAAHLMIVYTDHKNLEYFMLAWILNRHKVRWNMSLSRFDFIITYRLGKQQGLSNALSRRSYLMPKAGEAVFDQQCMTMLTLEQFWLCTTTLLIDVYFLY